MRDSPRGATQGASRLCASTHAASGGLHPALPRGDAGPPPDSFPCTASGFGPFAGFLPGCLNRKLQRTVWPFCSIAQGLEQLCWAGDGGEKPLAVAAWVWVSGSLLCCLLFLWGRVTACGSIRVSPEGMVSTGLRKQLKLSQPGRAF